MKRLSVGTTKTSSSLAARASVLLLALLANAGTLIAQESSSESTTTEEAAGSQTTTAPASSDVPRATFGEEIRVKVVNIPVYVTDKKTGEPITGLSIDDFELIEDRRPVTITNFYEVRDGDRFNEDGEKVEPGASSGDVLSSHPDIARRGGFDDVPADQRLHLVIYVDHFNIRPFNRNRVFRFLREFLRSNVQRSDRVMLVTYNRGDPKIVRTFTSDHAVITRALHEIETHTGGRSQYDSERRDLLRDLEEARSEGLVMGRVRMFAENVYNDMQFTLDGMRSMVNDLGGIPGRKAMLYVSDGLPMRAAEEMFHAADEKLRGDTSITGGQGVNVLDSLQYDLSRRFRELTRAANANNVAFYTIDAAGLRSSSLRGAETGYTEFSTNIDSIATSNMQSTLHYMADETGGQAITNTNNFSGGFEKIANDFGNYYSLGFQPSHAGSGRTYNIQCKVKMKRVRVRCKDNYRDKPIEVEMADSTLAGLRFGFQKNDLGIQLVPKESIPSANGTYVVHVDVRIPIGKVTLYPLGEVHEARLRAWVQAQDSNGDLSPVSQERIEFPIPADDLERAQKLFYTWTLPLRMAPGDQKLSVGVRDELAGVTSFVSRTLRIGSGVARGGG